MSGVRPRRPAAPLGRYAIVLADGVLADPPVVRRRLAFMTSIEDRAVPLVIAADGGARHAAALDIPPHTVVGDLDSIDPAFLDELRSRGGVDIISAPADKAETDLELALLHAAGLDLPRIVVLAAFGGRVDMMVSNLLLLTHRALEGRAVEVWDGWTSAWLIRPPGGLLVPPALPTAPWAPAPGDTLSLVPLAGDALGVTTHRLEYPLRSERLAFGPARGVSNVVLGTGASIDFEEGILLAVHAPSSRRRAHLERLHPPIGMDG